MKNIFRVSLLVALLAALSFGQQQGAQTLSTTTLGAAITTTNGTSVNLVSLTNVTATAAVQTLLYVDTEAMTVVTNSVPSSGTTVTVTRGAAGTKASFHASGRTVYVGRPNLFRNYDVSGSCVSGTGLSTTQPWINLSNGKLFQCLSGGEWINTGHGSVTGAAIETPASFCTGTVGSAETEYLNGAACSGATTATYSYVVTTAGEIANLRVRSSASETAAAGDKVTVYKNGSATTLLCTIPQTAPLTCSDLTHSFAVAVGDYIQFQNVSATSGASANVSATVGLYNQ